MCILIDSNEDSKKFEYLFYKMPYKEIEILISNGYIDGYKIIQ